MSVTQTSDNNLNPRTAVLVKLDDPNVTEPEHVAIALIDRDTIEITFNEENGDFEPHSTSRVKTDPTTENPTVSFDAARAVDDSALEELGIVDADGNYQRDGNRVWDFGAEIWYFESDADPTTDAPDMVDEFSTVRWDIDSYSTDGNTITFSAEGHLDDADITLGGTTST